MSAGVGMHGKACEVLMSAGAGMHGKACEVLMSAGVGMHGKACEVLMSAGVAPNNDNTWRLLHPNCMHALLQPPQFPLPLLQSALTLTS